MTAAAVPDELASDRTVPVRGAAPGSTSDPSTGPRPGASVDAVVVVHDGSAWLARCLDGIAVQTVPPGRLLVVDVGSTDTSAAIARAHARVRRVVPDVRLLEVDAGTTFGAALEAGLAALWGDRVVPGRQGQPAQQVPPGPGPDAAQWAWVLHDDTLAHPTALAHLLQAGMRSPSVGIAGPKVVDWDDPRRLVALGLQVTRTGRRLGYPSRGEADQGQYDQRTDVLAVSTPGMLLRRTVWDDLGGFDPAFTGYGADLDLGWRAQLAGHRVVVVPRAVVRDASAGTDGRRPGSPRPREVERRTRRATRQVTLARCSPLAAPFLAVWLAVSAVLGALGLLLAKRPRLAWRELCDVTALAHPLATTAARWRGRRTRRLRRDHLATLFVPPGVAARTTVDHFRDAVSPDRDRPRRGAAPGPETGPTADDAEALTDLPPSLARRVLTHPGVLAVVAALAVSTVAWRDLLRSGALAPTRTGVAGGELRPVATDAAGLWHAFADAWHGAGLGTAADAGPQLAVLSGLTWLAERVPGVADGRSSAGVTVAWLLFLAPVLAAWSAYLAGRVVTGSRTARAVVALAWGGAGLLTTSVAQGRLPLAVAHVLLPFVLAGFALAAGRAGTFTATFATALGVAVLGAFVPVLLVPSAGAALLLLVVGPGLRRARALVLLVVPLLLLGPWALHLAAEPRLLLSGPGLVATLPAAGAPALDRTVLASLLADPGGAGWVAWFAGPVVLLGLLGLAVPARSRARSVGLAAVALLAVVGLAAGLASDRVVLGSAETGVGSSSPAHPWAGVGLQLWLAALLTGLLAGSTVVLPALRGTVRWRRLLAGGVVGLVVAGVVGGSVARAVREGTELSVGRATLPAVAVEQGAGPAANRLLLLRPSEAVVDVVLVGREPGELLRDLDRPPDADDAPLLDAVADLVGGRSPTALDTSALARLGIGFVQVAGADDSGLARRLDASEGLSRLGRSAQGVLWKVRPLAPAPGAPDAAAPSRVRLVDASGGLLAAVPSVGPHGAVDLQLADGDLQRRLVLAEPVEWSAHATVTWSGTPLRPEAGQPQPTYLLPDGSGHLEVDLAAAAPWWRLSQAVLLAFVVFMALPFGNRRSRRRS